MNISVELDDRYVASLLNMFEYTTEKVLVWYNKLDDCYNVEELGNYWKTIAYPKYHRPDVLDKERVMFDDLALSFTRKRKVTKTPLLEEFTELLENHEMINGFRDKSLRDTGLPSNSLSSMPISSKSLSEYATFNCKDVIPGLLFTLILTSTVSPT